jgi:annexin A7/11
MESKYEADAIALREAMKGAGTDEAKIIEITVARRNVERQKIRQAYKNNFGRDMIEDLKTETGGNFQETIIGMYLDPIEYDVTEIYNAIQGAGTDEDSISEIVGSRSNRRLQEVKALYKQRHGENLEDRLKGETSGDYENLLVSILQCARDDSKDVHKDEVRRDVEALYNAGEGKWGTDEETFNRVFALRSSAHLAQVNALYQSLHEKSLLEVVDSEFGGNVRTLLRTVLHSHINPAEYFAERIYKACKGVGTTEKILNRALITTDEIMLPEIKKAYLQKYEISLEDQVAGETSGDHREMLLGLIKS